MFDMTNQAIGFGKYEEEIFINDNETNTNSTLLRKYLWIIMILSVFGIIIVFIYRIKQKSKIRQIEYFFSYFNNENIKDESIMQ